MSSISWSVSLIVSLLHHPTDISPSSFISGVCFTAGCLYNGWQTSALSVAFGLFGLVKLTLTTEEQKGSVSH